MVRCARCAHVWTALPADEPKGSDESTAASEDEDPIEAPDDEFGAGTGGPDEEAEEDGAGLLPDLDVPTVPPLAPDIPSHNDLQFSEPDDDQLQETGIASQDDIEGLFAAETDEKAVHDAPDEQSADDFDPDGAADPWMPEDDPAAEIDGDEPADDGHALENLAEDALEAQDEDPLDEGEETYEGDDEDDGTVDDEFVDEADEAPHDALLSETIEFAEQDPLFPSAAASPGKRRGKLVAGWSGLGCFMIVFIVMAYTYRVDIVRALPGSAGVYANLGILVNIRGLEIRDVTFSWETDSGAPILYVQGIIQNITNRPVPVPTVVFAFLDNRGEELYHWAKRMDASALPAGKHVNFMARVPSPPQAVENLQVRFAKPR